MQGRLKCDDHHSYYERPIDDSPIRKCIHCNKPHKEDVLIEEKKAKEFDLNDYIQICTQYNMYGIYNHYKGNEYYFDSISIRESDKTPLVNYSAVMGGVLWSRPLSEFFGEVETPNGIVKRFERKK